MNATLDCWTARSRFEAEFFFCATSIEVKIVPNQPDHPWCQRRMFFSEGVCDPFADVSDKMQDQFWNFEARLRKSRGNSNLGHKLLVGEILANENILASGFSVFERKPKSANAVVNINEASSTRDVHGPHPSSDVTDRFSNRSGTVVFFTDGRSRVDDHGRQSQFANEAFDLKFACGFGFAVKKVEMLKVVPRIFVTKNRF